MTSGPLFERVEVAPPAPTERAIVTTFRQYARIVDAIAAGELDEDWGPALEYRDEDGDYHQIRRCGDELQERGHLGGGPWERWCELGGDGHGDYVAVGVTFSLLERGPCIVIPTADIVESDEDEHDDDDPAWRWPT